MYTENGQDYWTSQSCGNPNCRTCEGNDHLIKRQVGYLRRNELGRTVDRGFSSKPRKLRLPHEMNDDDEFGGGPSSTNQRRYDSSPVGASQSMPTTMRDPFNRVIEVPQTTYGYNRFDNDMRGNNCE